MCPGCITTVLLMVAGVTSIGSVTAFAAKRFRVNADAVKLEPRLSDSLLEE